ncbi:uncharacterized protein STEHIDRAFT_118479 [Stereum hirsutum FP-91666 SS1]|uniref:uncharacterized protein n=1 Tax=Stereum hirsutum (strain FP-91666) TaxID=721885 RepID=UPI000440C3FB|nr:uncharacterized protein STEHIDRAFT_118479 [Stereum hirsutum FP-91666 SS1]EIM91416.1 hypothetical protein STEHIDRAFT_118479 [Stereum hirsutum FP-91666 SS1]
MEASIPHLSFIAAVDLSEEARFLYISESICDILGYEPHELLGTPSVNLNHPEENLQVVALHCDTVRKDKAAAIAYIRLRHKDASKGYVMCVTTRTVAHDVLVGSVSIAMMGPKAMHYASTAQEVKIVTPAAWRFNIHRWITHSSLILQAASHISANDFLPRQQYGSEGDAPSFRPSNVIEDSHPTPSSPQISLGTLVAPILPSPAQSTRMALILDRFSLDCHILYCFNNPFLRIGTLAGLSFFDFVAARDEEFVRSLIMTVKGWGVNELGQPSDGGFGFGRFHLCLTRRGLSTGLPGLRPPRRLRPRRGINTSTRFIYDGRSQINTDQDNEELLVDAIFSPHSDGLVVVLRPAA